MRYVRMALPTADQDREILKTWSDPSKDPLSKSSMGLFWNAGDGDGGGVSIEEVRRAAVEGFRGSLLELQRLYHQILLIPQALASYQQALSARNNSPDSRSESVWFLRNPLAQELSSMEGVKEEKTRIEATWTSLSLERWNTKLGKREEFLTIAADPSPSVEHHHKVLTFLFSGFLFKDKEVEAVFRDRNLYWSENRQLVLGVVKATLDSRLVPGASGFKLAPLLCKEDKDFVWTVFPRTLVMDFPLGRLIQQHAQNWRTERMHLLDLAILKVALAEILSCRAVPKKVTINEYLEITGKYSGPKGKNFINGVLDSIIGSLESDGLVQKTGLGLLDNR